MAELNIIPTAAEVELIKKAVARACEVCDIKPMECRFDGNSVEIGGTGASIAVEDRVMPKGNVVRMFVAYVTIDVSSNHRDEPPDADVIELGEYTRVWDAVAIVMIRWVTEQVSNLALEESMVESLNFL